MTIVYIILIFLQAGVIAYFVMRGRKLKKEIANQQALPAGDTYAGFRNLAIKITPLQLKLAIPPTETIVYGVVMDWDMGASVATLAAYLTGAANLCFSTGGVVKGGGIKPSVGEAAVDFVMASQVYLDRAIPVNTTDLPVNGCVRFYFLTNKGMYAAQEHVKHFDDQSSPWLNLFLKGNDVIHEIQGMLN